MKRNKILIVEDESEVRKMIARIIKRKYEDLIPVQAINGLDALKQLQIIYVTTALIISDVNMPKMSANNMIREIKKSKDFLQIPIILMSGNATLEDRKKALSFGANYFLPKPFEINDLCQLIDKIIKEQNASK